jgi:hypothetical protein
MVTIVPDPYFKNIFTTLTMVIIQWLRLCFFNSFFSFFYFAKVAIVFEKSQI